MFRFRIATIPIEVHASHLALTLMLAFMFAQPHGDLDWSAHAPTPILIAIWSAIISFSVLFHEMGHAFASRAFGYRPVVQLIGMGGLTHPGPNETIPWHRQVLLTLAGPAAGMSLAIGAAVLRFVLGKLGELPAPLDYALDGMAIANGFWAVLNMLPIHPLDGSHIASAVLIRIFGRDGFLYAQIVGVCVGGIFAAWAFAQHQQMLGFFAVLYLWQTFVNINRYRRGELPSTALHPFEQATMNAEQLAREDKLPEARTMVDQLLALDLQPTLRARLHLLAGWISLKLGEGRKALDHFSMAGGAQVPPHALAAAFSLVGDDVRALPLWQAAVAKVPDAMLQHELAGTLIRLGRAREALALPGVKVTPAYECAEGVFVARQDFGGAARALEASNEAEPTVAKAYESARDFAKAGLPDDAVRMLEKATSQGFKRRGARLQ